MAIVNAFIQLADPTYQNLPIRDRLKGIVEALFRVFDANGNGIIEPFELNEILTDVISGVVNILTTLIDILEPHFLKADEMPPPPTTPVIPATTIPLFTAISPWGFHICPCSVGIWLYKVMQERDIIIAVR
jgi:hypothetical protein